MDYGPMSIDAFTYGSHSVKGRCEYMSVATVRFWPRVPFHACRRKQSSADFPFKSNVCYGDSYRAHTPV